MKEKLKNIGKSALILIGFFFIYAVIGTYFIQFTENLVLKKYIENAVQFVLCLGLIYFYRDKLKNDFKELKRLSIKKIAKYLIIYVVAYILSSLANDIIYHYIKILPNNEITVQAFIKTFPINGILSAVILAPFYEEIVVRLNLKSIFRKKWTFILFSGILFGSFHMMSAISINEFLYILPYSILGICLSYIFVDSNTIYTSIFFHAINNLIQIILIFGGGF